MPHPTVRLSALYGNATVLSLTAVRWREEPRLLLQVQQTWRRMRDLNPHGISPATFPR